jgi:hypothetical protein
MIKVIQGRDIPTSTVARRLVLSQGCGALVILLHHDVILGVIVALMLGTALRLVDTVVLWTVVLIALLTCLLCTLLQYGGSLAVPPASPATSVWGLPVGDGISSAAQSTFEGLCALLIVQIAGWWRRGTRGVAPGRDQGPMNGQL